jgi:ABC-type dipeptide/oligopeptide/nickel transport system permease component
MDHELRKRGTSAMAGYVLKRVLQLVPVLVVIICVNFLIIHLAPGDPVSYLTGDAPVSQEFLDELRAQYGLDQPLWRQLLTYLGRVAQGDLGYSFVSRDQVAAIIWSRLPATLLLLGAQFVLSVIIGIALGVLAAARRAGGVDHAVSVISLLGFAVPAFWLGQMMILIFALWLGLLPAQGMRSLRVDLTGWPAIVDLLRHLALPTLTLTLFNLALVARVTRANMVEVMRMEFVTFARSKGVPERAVLLHHGLRNAILPVITVIGLNVRTLIAGAVLTETVFAWPGIGRLTYEAIFARDYPVLMGILVVIGLVVVLANVAVDIAYAVLDPRVRLR